MNRRKFFRNTTLGALGTTLLTPFNRMEAAETANSLKNKKAKNIIFLVSDGMSIGTLNMTDLLLTRKNGSGSHWLELYRNSKITRALMDTSSASSIVTDSAAASSSWGGGFKVPNGRINIDADDKEHLPIWQKFKSKGKKTGCVTTVPITHATPAGFCIAQKSRNDQESIAEKYLKNGFDVLMGGGKEYFLADRRKDGQNLIESFKEKGYQILYNSEDLNAARSNAPVLGLFSENGLPYSKDRDSSKKYSESIPSLSEMTLKAIECLQNDQNGFVLQVEAGKVDWAAHANDIAGLVYDQVAFDEAVRTAIDFAEKDGETLVIITTDHGNANPGIIYGGHANQDFDSIQNYKHTNDWILNGLSSSSSIETVKERVNYANGMNLKNEEALTLLSYYQGLQADEGLYNPKKLPFRALAEMQQKHNSVGWISMQHSADFVELAMYGPGSHLLKPFVKNTDLHYLMLEAAEVENNF